MITPFIGILWIDICADNMEYQHHFSNETHKLNNDAEQPSVAPLDYETTARERVASLASDPSQLRQFIENIKYKSLRRELSAQYEIEYADKGVINTLLSDLDANHGATPAVAEKHAKNWRAIELALDWTPEEAGNILAEGRHGNVNILAIVEQLASVKNKRLARPFLLMLQRKLVDMETQAAGQSVSGIAGQDMKDWMSGSTEVVLTLIKNGTEETKNYARSFAAHNIERILQDMDNTNSYREVADIIVDICRSSGGYHQDEMIKALECLSEENQHYIVAALVADSSDGCLRVARNFKMLRFSVEDLRRLLKIWQLSDRKEKLTFTVLSNIERIDEVERLRPGSVKILEQEFGILNFGRYDAKTLAYIYDNKDKDDLPHGYLIYPYNDHNGAFMRDKEIIRQLVDSMASKYYLRIVEVKNKRGLIHKLMRLKAHYPSHPEAAFIILGGHGTPDSIQLGDESDEQNSIYAENLGIESNDRRRGLAKKLGSRVLKKGAPIVLISCSTGQEEGIGQKLSEAFETEVIAPDMSTNLKSLDPVFDQRGNLHTFKVEYTDANSAKKYVRGRQNSA